jgi:hypothetical protein
MWRGALRLCLLQISIHPKPDTLSVELGQVSPEFVELFGHGLAMHVFVAVNSSSSNCSATGCAIFETFAETSERKAVQREPWGALTTIARARREEVRRRKLVAVSEVSMFGSYIAA